MNTNGLHNVPLLCEKLNKYYDCHISVNSSHNEFTLIINKINEEYYFSEYYDLLIEHNIKTPKSFILFTVNDLYNRASIINQIILNEFNSKVFARLDTCSTKPDTYFTCMQDIITNFENADRIQPWMKDPHHIVVLREYVNLKDYIELRCFVENKKIRGITSTDDYDENPTMEIIQLIIDICNKTIYYTEYEHCTIDVAVNNKTKDVMIIEINTPCWLCSTSGLFDLSDKNDVDILF